MRRQAALLAIVLGMVSGCATAVAGTASPVLIIGVAQQASAGPDLEVRPLVFLDPAPLDESQPYASEPADGTRLVAVRFKVTNHGPDDELIGPTGTVHFHASNNKTYDDSLADTSAGPMFDQTWVAHERSVVGYLAAEIPEDVTVKSVDFEVGFDRAGDVLRWDVAGPNVVTKVADVPDPPTGSKADKHRLGEKASINGTRDGADYALSVAATKIVDPAQPTDQVEPGRNHRLVGVEFTATNTGPTPYDDRESDSDLRIFTLYNTADEAIVSHIYGATEEHGFPLASKATDKWTLLFDVPTDFDIDRVSFTPMFGQTATTFWATS